MRTVTVYAPDAQTETGGHNRQPRWRIVIVVILLVGAVTLIAAPHVGTKDETPACVRVTRPADAADVDAIKLLIDHAEDIYVIGLQTLDTTRYSTVYSNDPCVRLEGGQADYVHRIRKQFGSEGGMETDGWLAFETALIVDRRGGIAIEQQRRQTATAAMQAGVTPASRGSTRGQTPTAVPRVITGTQRFPIHYDEILSDGDRAEVVYDPGSAIRHAFLVRTPDGWRIAGERIIKYTV
ncbi:MAG: hypothetical protein ACYDAR_22270 [Thermomicrobiales bacterium]